VVEEKWRRHRPLPHLPSQHSVYLWHQLPWG
jgi:hypothetical protein